jgi:hypothetical protein
MSKFVPDAARRPDLPLQSPRQPWWYSPRLPPDQSPETDNRHMTRYGFAFGERGEVVEVTSRKTSRTEAVGSGRRLDQVSSRGDARDTVLRQRDTELTAVFKGGSTSCCEHRDRRMSV